MSISSGARSPMARASRSTAAATLLSVLLTLAACGQSNQGTSASPTLSNCSPTACTVSYPAKARNGQASAGGPGIPVLGVDTQLAEISQGAALIRIGTTSVNIDEGKSATQAGLTATVTSLTSTAAVIEFKKA